MNVLRKRVVDLREHFEAPAKRRAIRSYAPPAGLEPATLRVGERAPIEASSSHLACSRYTSARLDHVSFGGRPHRIAPYLLRKRAFDLGRRAGVLVAMIGAVILVALLVGALGG